MQLVRLAIVAIAIAAPVAASAQAVEKGTIGVGVVLGEPTGLSAKLYLSDDTAIQAAVGLNFATDAIQVHADYLWHPWLLEEQASFVLAVYVGPGVRVAQYDRGRDGDDYFAIGGRGVGGLLFDFKEVPLDAFVEAAGVLEIGLGGGESGAVGVKLNAGVGARYYF